MWRYDGENENNVACRNDNTGECPEKSYDANSLDYIRSVAAIKRAETWGSFPKF